jgi:PAS domain S-box-containing protein
MAKSVDINKKKRPSMFWKPNTTATAAELRQHAEACQRDRLRDRQPQPMVQQTEIDSLRAFHELEVNQIELELQNDELQRARDELELGYVSLDEAGLILEMNLAGAVLLGVGRSRLIDRCLLLFMPMSYRPIFQAYLKTAFAGAAHPDCEIQLLKESGTFWASFTAADARSLNGARKRCQFSFADITARKQSALLSSRELEVLRLIANGNANKQIAMELEISMRTVEKHRAHLMTKLDIHDTAGLTRYAMDSGLLDSGAQPTTVQSGKMAGLLDSPHLLSTGLGPNSFHGHV